MVEYKFITCWHIHAPLPQVWELIKDIRRWHEWWRGVLEVHEIRKGNEDDIGTCFGHTWRSYLPYKLQFETEISKVLPYECIEAIVSGELKGTGRWKFENGKKNQTIVYYHWNVMTTKPWMNLTAPLLKGVFRSNHNAVMRWGGKGIAKKLNCKVVFSHEDLK